MTGAAGGNGGEVVITGAARTAIGRFRGAFSDVPAHTLGSAAIRGALGQAGMEPGEVGEVILGCVGAVGLDIFLARRAALDAGLPISTPAFNINRLCSSGLQAIWSGVQEIQTGAARAVVAGGAENLTRQPFLDYQERSSLPIGDRVILDGTFALFSDWEGHKMGETAEVVAEHFGITRERQDRYALQSQQRAARAIEEGVFARQIIPIDDIVADEHPRPQTTLGALTALRPAFREGGTVTAGNASGINDGAAAVVLETSESAHANGRRPIGRFIACALHALEPSLMGFAPAEAIRKALSSAGLSLEDIDVIEFNEAFAAQVLAVCDALEIASDDPRLNPDGGAIALGHPVGATGAVMVVKALDLLERRNGRYALVTMCIGGGQGIAMILERVAS
jgi:acetyl-CoA C-acetyltransferase